jgi:hypothetical protein
MAGASWYVEGPALPSPCVPSRIVRVKSRRLSRTEMGISRQQWETPRERHRGPLAQGNRPPGGAGRLGTRTPTPPFPVESPVPSAGRTAVNSAGWNTATRRDHGRERERER